MSGRLLDAARQKKSPLPREFGRRDRPRTARVIAGQRGHASGAEKLPGAVLRIADAIGVKNDDVAAVEN